MSELKPKSIKLKDPIYLHKKNNRLIRIPVNGAELHNHTKAPMKKVKVLSLIKEQVIFETDDACFLRNQYTKLTLKNQWHRLTSHCYTIATYTKLDGTQIQATSRSISKLIGQKNYDTLFVALCSILCKELKYRAILSLLVQEQTVTTDKSTQTESPDNIKTVADCIKKYKESSCQTDVSNTTVFNKKKTRIKRNVIPWVVKNDVTNHNFMKALSEREVRPKKIVIDPNNKEDILKLGIDMSLDAKSVMKGDRSMFREKDDDEHSNMTLSGFSVCSETVNAIMCNIFSESTTEVNNILSYTKEDIEPKELQVCSPHQFPKNLNKYEPIVNNLEPIMNNLEPIINKLPIEGRTPFLKQFNEDLKLCLETDEDGFMRLHLAVLNNDLPMIQRQCTLLKLRQQSIDLPTHSKMTALKLSIQADCTPECASVLISHGADPILVDAEQRTSFHHAAGLPTGHLKAIMQATSVKAREILMENDELHSPCVDIKSNEEVARHLFLEISVMTDDQGYTPLMIASKLGMHDNVKQLVTSAPETVNTGMATTGYTALYLAVSEACLTAAEGGKKCKISDNYIRTIETLVDNGADSEIQDLSGNKISDILQEFNCQNLQLLIANRVTSKNFDVPLANTSKDINSFMLIKDSKGKINLIDNAKTDKQNKPKLTILEDITLNSPETYDTNKKTPNNVPLAAVEDQQKTIEDVPVNIIIRSHNSVTNISRSNGGVIKMAPNNSLKKTVEINKRKASAPSNLQLKEKYTKIEKQ